MIASHVVSRAEATPVPKIRLSGPHTAAPRNTLPLRLLTAACVPPGARTPPQAGSLNANARLYPPDKGKVGHGCPSQGHVWPSRGGYQGLGQGWASQHPVSITDPLGPPPPPRLLKQRGLCSQGRSVFSVLTLHGLDPGWFCRSYQNTHSCVRFVGLAANGRPLLQTPCRPRRLSRQAGMTRRKSVGEADAVPKPTPGGWKKPSIRNQTTRRTETQRGWPTHPRRCGVALRHPDTPPAGHAPGALCRRIAFNWARRELRNTRRCRR